METKKLTTADELTLTYYMSGSAGEYIVMVNAPGMSVELWSWIIRELRDQYTVIAFDYRGFPVAERELSDSESRFENVTADLSAILEREGVPAAHFVSWGLGAKVAFDFQRKFPEKVLSLIPISMDDDALGSDANSSFSRAVLAVKRQLDAAPESINSVIKVIRRIGAPSSINLFQAALQGDDLKPIVKLIDMLVLESSMSNLALYHLERSPGLNNYLKLYAAFSGFEVEADFENIKVPVVIVEGDSDGLAAIGPSLRRDLGSIEDVEWKTIERASHFLPMEYPEKTANIIMSAVGRAGSSRRSAQVIVGDLHSMEAYR
jgi:pimeloyl-ACP methyl ester carboxylesterase